MDFDPMAVSNLLRKESVTGVMARGASASLVIHVIGTGLALILQVLLARILGKENFGLYAYSISWITVLASAGMLGTDVATLRFVPAYLGKGQWSLTRGFIRGSLIAVLIASCSIGLSVALILIAIRRFIEPGLSATLLTGCMLLPVLATLFVQSARLQALKRIVLAQMPREVVRNVLILAAVVLYPVLVGAKPGAPYAMMANVAATALVLVFVSAALFRCMPAEVRAAHPQYRWKEWTGTAGTIMVLGGFSLALSNVDVIMIGTLLDPTQAGIYSAASRIAILISFGLIAVNMIAAPIISDLYARGLLSDLQSTLTLAVQAVFGVSLAAGAFLTVGGKWVLGLFGFEFIASYHALLILIVGQIVNASAGSVALIMMMTGHHKQAAIILSIVFGLDLLLNLMLIPLFGIEGGAIATSISMVLWNLIMVVYVVRVIRIDPTILSALRRKT
jgi:O-antigen/teichoic acid export membrane protein